FQAAPTPPLVVGRQGSRGARGHITEETDRALRPTRRLCRSSNIAGRRGLHSVAWPAVRVLGAANVFLVPRRRGALCGVAGPPARLPWQALPLACRGGAQAELHPQNIGQKLC